ncbi:MAG: 30S ribosomal protein THX, partial [Flavobacteriales bacterium]|nr:30S ribosomal protein THX [Flavobacteriales bacterium]
MGKGDRKSGKGKRFKGSYGNTRRPSRENKTQEEL